MKIYDVEEGSGSGSTSRYACCGNILAGGSRWICFVAAEVDGRFCRIIGIVDWRWRWDFWLQWQIFVIGDEWYGSDGSVGSFLAAVAWWGNLLKLLEVWMKFGIGLFSQQMQFCNGGMNGTAALCLLAAALLDERLVGIVLWRRRLMSALADLLGLRLGGGSRCALWRIFFKWRWVVAEDAIFLMGGGWYGSNLSPRGGVA